MNRLIKICFGAVGNLNPVWFDHCTKENNTFSMMLQIDLPGMQLQHQVRHQVFAGCRDDRFQIFQVRMDHHKPGSSVTTNPWPIAHA
jgi:hypothetical protein